MNEILEWLLFFVGLVLKKGVVFLFQVKRFNWQTFFYINSI
jgi:hypothetical protein